MPLRLVSAGIAAVAVTFGFARYGYGLLLPDIRADLGVGRAVLGLIATGSYAAYLAATAAVPALVLRAGGRTTVAVGLGLAALGMLLVGLSPGPVGLAVGLLVAGASSGLVFPPFADAVARLVTAPAQGRAFSAISCGTGWGVAVAVPLALAAGGAWRAAWLVYAALAAVALVWALRVLPPLRGGAAADALPPLRLGWLVCPRSGPLLVGALLVGVGASVYWTFAVDHVVAAGGVPAAQARLLLVAVGLASLAGTLGGDMLGRLGGRASLGLSALALGAALALLGLAPGAPGLVIVSGVLFGAGYNLALAIQGIWSARVFADRPSTGLAAVMFLLGTGLLVGPFLAGLLAGPLGLDGVFVLGALVVTAVALLFPREELVARRPAVAGA